MSYRPRGRARVNAEDPRAFAVCDRCGFLYNHDQLRWQYQWQGEKLYNKRILVCETCNDKPSMFLRAIVIPADPKPIFNPRVEPYSIDEAGGWAYLYGPDGQLLLGPDGQPMLRPVGLHP